MLESINKKLIQLIPWSSSISSVWIRFRDHIEILGHRFISHIDFSASNIVSHNTASSSLYSGSASTSNRRTNSSSGTSRRLARRFRVGKFVPPAALRFTWNQCKLFQKRLCRGWPAYQTLEPKLVWQGCLSTGSIVHNKENIQNGYSQTFSYNSK